MLLQQKYVIKCKKCSLLAPSWIRVIAQCSTKALGSTYQICFSQKLICAKFGMIVQFYTHEAKPHIHITPLKERKLRMCM